MTTQTANSRINSTWERVAVWAGGVAIALLVVVYQDMRTTVDKLEEQVQFLYLDKVSKQDMEKLADRFEKRIEANNSDVISRLELIIQAQKNK